MKRTAAILALAAAALQSGFCADASAPDAANTNAVRRWRGRRVYDRKIEWHQSPTATPSPRERVSHTSAAPDHRLPDLGLHSPAIPLQPAPLYVPPSVVLQREQQKQEQRDSDNWINSSVEQILGVDSGTNNASGWGWLANQVLASETNAQAAAEEVSGESPLAESSRGLIGLGEEKEGGGLVTDTPPPDLNTRLRKLRERDNAPIGSVSSDSTGRFSVSLRSEDAQDTGRSRAGVPDAAKTTAEEVSTRNGTGPASPAAEAIPEGPAFPQMEKIFSQIRPSATDFKPGAATVPALPAAAAVRRELSKPLDPAITHWGPSTTIPTPAPSTAMPGRTGSRYGERGGTFSPGFRGTTGGRGLGGEFGTPSPSFSSRSDSFKPFQPAGFLPAATPWQAPAGGRSFPSSSGAHSTTLPQPGRAAEGSLLGPSW